MKKSIHYYGFLFSTALIYTVSVLLVLSTLYFFLQRPPIFVSIEASPYHLSEFVISIVLALLLLYLLLRFVKSSLIFTSLFYVILFSGMISFFSLLVSIPFAVGITCLLLICHALFQTIFWHNINLIFALCGIGIYLGFSFSFHIAFFLLLIFSFYDILAVFVTRHMIRLFVALKERGMILAFLLPQHISQWSMPIKDSWAAKVGVLGTGDIAFALFITVASISQGLLTSILIAIGGLFGLLWLQAYIYAQKSRRPWPALPAITVGAFLGWLISLFL